MRSVSPLTPAGRRNISSTKVAGSGRRLPPGSCPDRYAELGLQSGQTAPSANRAPDGGVVRQRIGRALVIAPHDVVESGVDTCRSGCNHQRGKWH